MFHLNLDPVGNVDSIEFAVKIKRGLSAGISISVMGGLNLWKIGDTNLRIRLDSAGFARKFDQSRAISPRRRLYHRGMAHTVRMRHSFI